MASGLDQIAEIEREVRVQLDERLMRSKIAIVGISGLPEEKRRIGKRTQSSLHERIAFYGI